MAGGLATIMINRPPKMNSLTAETMRELEVAFDAAGSNPEVGVVVFTGAGDRPTVLEPMSRGRRRDGWDEAAPPCSVRPT